MICDSKIQQPIISLASTGYSLAGFVFGQAQGKTCPLDSFVVDSLGISSTLQELMIEANADYGAVNVFVPPIAAKERPMQTMHNQLYQAIHRPFSPHLMVCTPEPITALLLRSQALKDSQLDESLYHGAAKLSEKLKQLSEDRPASAYVLAYLSGIYQILHKRPEPLKRHTYKFRHTYH